MLKFLTFVLSKHKTNLLALNGPLIQIGVCLMHNLNEYAAR